MLRHPEQIDLMIGTLRDAISLPFTVKTRVGYESPDEFGGLLNAFKRHGIDGLTIHGRTVKERYQTPVHPHCVKRAVKVMDCPVIANGNVVDARTAKAYYKATNAAGLMVGRGAIRNPWIFSDLGRAFHGLEPERHSHRDLMEFIFELDEEIARQSKRYEANAHVQRIKKPVAYITHGISDGEFEYSFRRVKNYEDFRSLCRSHLDHDLPLPQLPPSGSKLFCGF